MDLLPSDIRANILEYQGGQSQLRLSDEELIERIKLYEPTFNYNRWQQQIALKKEFNADIDNSKLIPLAKYIKESGVELRISIKPNIIRVYLDNVLGDKNNVFFTVIRHMKYAGYDPTILSEDNPMVQVIEIADRDEFQYELAAIWMMSFPRSSQESYTALKDNYMGTSEYGDLYKYIDTLHIPITLAGYLRYAIDRAKNPLKKSRLHTLYWMIQSYHVDQDEDIINIEDIEQSMADQVGIELSSLFPEVEIQHTGNNYGHSFEITGKNLRELMDIDIFYHPYAIGAVDSFPPN